MKKKRKIMKMIKTKMLMTTRMRKSQNNMINK
jgi:hypothetical protein